MKKNILLSMFSLLIIFTVTLNLVGCNNSKNENTNTEENINTEADSVVYFMSGKVQADESADITSKINARILNINADIGSTVKKGDCVINLDSKDLEAQVAQAQADVNTAESNLNKAKSGTRPEQIAQAQATLDSAKANYDTSKANNERNQNLFDSGAIPKAQLEQSQTAYTVAESSYKSAQAALEMLNNGETSQTIATFEAQLKKAQAVLATTQVQLQNGMIVSPISGVVTAKNIKDGELATVGAPILTIVNLDTVVINAYIPTTYINKISLNQEVIIKVSEIPDKKFNGEIVVIDSASDPKSKNVFVKVKFKDKDELLKPGMFAEIGIIE